MGIFGAHINQMAADKLCTLIQKENFIGWIYSLDYDNALVVTNDAFMILTLICVVMALRK